MSTTKYHRPGVRLNSRDKADLDLIADFYGSEAQAIRVAIRKHAIQLFGYERQTSANPEQPPS